MKKSVEAFVSSAQNEAANGNFCSARVLYKKALEESKEDFGEVLFETGAFLFVNKIYNEALDAFIECINVGYQPEKVKEIVLDAYYKSNINEFKQKYEANVSALMKYKYIEVREYPEFDDLHYCFLPYSDNIFAIFNSKSNQIVSNNYNLRHNKYKFNDLTKDHVFLFKDEFSEYILKEALRKTIDPEPFLWSKIPVYLYYENFNEFIQYMQLCDFTKLLESERFVFLFGRDELEKFLLDPQSVFPTTAFNISRDKDDMYDFLKGIFEKRELNCKFRIEESNCYYDRLNEEDILKNIKSGKPRILFITTRFSTAIQYYIRDCATACDRLHIPNKVLMEKSDIHRLGTESYISSINEFKPDIIFQIDHFRWEDKPIHKNTVFVCWAQDPLSAIMSKDSALKIGPLDFVLNAWITYQDFLNIGYPEERLIDAPVPSNPDIYKKYSLSKNEIEQYSTDICVISNPGNPEIGFKNVLSYFKDLPDYLVWEKVLRGAYDEACHDIYNENSIRDINQQKALISKWLQYYNIKQVGNTIIDDVRMDRIVKIFKNNVIGVLYRSIPILWLHEKGYEMKLWGTEWMTHPILSKYAMGVAKNGETLSKILNATKISIGTNPFLTAHPRVGETILSDCFYLAYKIPEIYDYSNIAKIMDEESEIIFFHNKNDLYQKVDYYLSHEEERKKIISNGKNKILSTLTYEVLIKNVISQIGQRLEAQLSYSI